MYNPLIVAFDLSKLLKDGKITFQRSMKNYFV